MVRRLNFEGQRPLLVTEKRKVLRTVTSRYHDDYGKLACGVQGPDEQTRHTLTRFAGESHPLRLELIGPFLADKRGSQIAALRKAPHAAHIDGLQFLAAPEPFPRC